MNNHPTALQRVKYPHVANRDDGPEALGRNGWMKAIGLEVFDWQSKQVVQLQPINSRGEPGRCVIELPLDKQTLRELAQKLLDIADRL